MPGAAATPAKVPKASAAIVEASFIVIVSGPGAFRLCPDRLSNRAADGLPHLAVVHVPAASERRREQRPTLGVWRKTPFVDRAQANDNALASLCFGKQSVVRPSIDLASRRQLSGHMLVSCAFLGTIGKEIDEGDFRRRVIIGEAELRKTTLSPGASSGVCREAGQWRITTQILRHKVAHLGHLCFITFSAVEAAVQRQQDDGRCAYGTHEGAYQRIESEGVPIVTERGGVLGVNMQVGDSLSPKIGGGRQW